MQLHFMSVTFQGACHKTRLCHGLAFFFIEGLLLTDCGRALILWEFHGWPPLHSWLRLFLRIWTSSPKEMDVFQFEVWIFIIYTLTYQRNRLTCSKYFGTLVEGHPTWDCYLSALGTAWLAQCHKRLCDHRHNILSVSATNKSFLWRKVLAQVIYEYFNLIALDPIPSLLPPFGGHGWHNSQQVFPPNMVLNWNFHPMLSLLLINKKILFTSGVKNIFILTYEGIDGFSVCDCPILTLEPLPNKTSKHLLIQVYNLYFP